MNHVCRRCFTAFGPKQVLSDHIESCIKQKPAIIGFSWKDSIISEEHHMKLSLPFRVHGDFDCNIQPTFVANNANVFTQTNFNCSRLLFKLAIWKSTPE